MVVTLGVGASGVNAWQACGSSALRTHRHWRLPHLFHVRLLQDQGLLDHHRAQRFGKVHGGDVKHAQSFAMGAKRLPKPR